jgi:hypothetical protein
LEIWEYWQEHLVLDLIVFQMFDAIASS